MSRYNDPGMLKGIHCHGSAVETTEVNKVYNFFKTPVNIINIQGIQIQQNINSLQNSGVQYYAAASFSNNRASDKKLRPVCE